MTATAKTMRRSSFSVPHLPLRLLQHPFSAESGGELAGKGEMYLEGSGLWHSEEEYTEQVWRWGDHQASMAVDDPGLRGPSLWRDSSSTHRLGLRDISLNINDL